jgi:raffinose/stachyose/melibiose transport system permease protein
MQLNLFNNLTAIIVALAMGQIPISVYLFATFFRFFPNEVMESAVIDGCSIPQVFVRIVLPLTRNTIITVIICNFFVFWNDFIVTNTFTTRTELRTIQVGVSLFVGNFNLTEWGPIFAGLTMATLPIAVLYLFLNRQILTGIVEGSIKG